MELSFMGWSNTTVFIKFILLYSFITTKVFSYPTPVDFTGKLLKWDMQKFITVKYSVIAERESDRFIFIGTAQESANLWSNVSTSQLRLEEANSLEEAQITMELVRSLDGSGFSSGYSLFDQYDDDSNPLHCQIKILVHSSFSFEQIAKTILHEFGHCLGLGHSLIPESIMSYQLNKNRFALDLDDIAAISRLYPQGSHSAKIAQGCAIGTQQEKSSNPVIILFIPLLILLISGGKKLWCMKHQS